MNMLFKGVSILLSIFLTQICGYHAEIVCKFNAEGLCAVEDKEGWCGFRVWPLGDYARVFCVCWR